MGTIIVVIRMHLPVRRRIYVYSIHPVAPAAPRKWRRRPCPWRRRAGGEVDSGTGAPLRREDRVDTGRSAGHRAAERAVRVEEARGKAWYKMKLLTVNKLTSR